MFKKKQAIKIENMEAINFCRLLGKYGIKFEISGIRSIVSDDGSNKKFYRLFTVYTSRHRAYELLHEFNISRHYQIDT